MFWGLVVEPNRKYSQKVSRPFHISQAVLVVTSTTEDPDVQLILSSTKCENEDNIENIDTVEYILCVLKKSGTVQVPLNLIFSEGDDISFRSVGGTVHLTGYSVDERNFQEWSDEDETYDGRHTERRRMAQESSDSDSEGGSGDEENGSDYEECAEGEDEVDNDSEEEEEKPIPPPVKRPKFNKEVNGKGNINEPKKAQKPKVVENKIRRLDGGLMFEDIRKGKGPAVKSGNTVWIYFDGILQSNKQSVEKFQSGKGYKFTVGRGEVIQGWDIGIVGMKVNGKRKITCPPGKAYGARGNPPSIPQNATLVYQIELRSML